MIIELDPSMDKVIEKLIQHVIRSKRARRWGELHEHSPYEGVLKPQGLLMTEEKLATRLHVHLLVGLHDYKAITLKKHLDRLTGATAEEGLE